MDALTHVKKAVHDFELFKHTSSVLIVDYQNAINNITKAFLILFKKNSWVRSVLSDNMVYDTVVHSPSISQCFIGSSSAGKFYGIRRRSTGYLVGIFLQD